MGIFAERRYEYVAQWRGRSGVGEEIAKWWKIPRTRLILTSILLRVIGAFALEVHYDLNSELRNIVLCGEADEVRVEETQIRKVLNEAKPGVTIEKRKVVQPHHERFERGW